MEQIKLFKCLYMYKVARLFLNFVAIETFWRHQRQYLCVWGKYWLLERL